MKDQIRKQTLKKIDRDLSAAESDSDDDGSDLDDDQKVEKRHSKESKLFTKLGVSKKDEEAQLKRDFKKQANQADDDSEDSDGGFLKMKSD